MLRSITLSQFYEWMTFAEFEPFDEARDDYRTAQIVQTLINMNRDTKRHPEPIPINDCLLVFGDAIVEKPKKQTWQEQKMIAMMYVAAANKKE